jgi:hypothetical protein
MSEGEMIRSLGEAERFFWLFDRINCMNFAVYAELDKPLETTLLEQALNELVLETPALNTRVEAKGKKLFFVEAAAVPLQVEKIQSDRGWKSIVLAEMIKPLNPCSAPMVRCLLIGGEQAGSIVVMIFNHTISDGRSAIHFTKNLLKRALGEKSVNPKRAGLSPAMETLFPKKYRGVSGRIRGNLFRILEGFQWKQYGKLEALPDYKTDIKQEREPGSYQLVLDGELLEKLKDKAREEGTTLHGLIGAAQLLALREEFGDDESHPMTLTSLADMRGELIQLVLTAELALQITFLVTTHRVGNAESTWELARDVRQQLKQKLAKGDGHLFWNSLPPPLLVPPNQNGAERLLKVTRALSPPSTLISNMGDVSDTKPELLSGVRSLSLLICPSSITPINSTVNSWNGHLFINLNYDALKMAPVRIERIAEAMQGFMLKALK